MLCCVDGEEGGGNVNVNVNVNVGNDLKYDVNHDMNVNVAARMPVFTDAFVIMLFMCCFVCALSFLSLQAKTGKNWRLMKEKEEAKTWCPLGPAKVR